MKFKINFKPLEKFSKFMVSKKPSKKSTAISPFLTSSWFDIDKSIDNLKKEMEKAFSSFPTMSMPKMSQTSCDVIDEGKQFRVKMDVPGIKNNEIKLNVTENSLEVSGEHKEESEEKKKNYLTKERSQVSYYRTLTDGVLDITLPKSKPTKTQKKKSISVQ
jgi:HSP20 family protein